MATIFDVIDRVQPPVPWEEGDNIPWDDPDFSARMLEFHLSQADDRATRRRPAVESHVERIGGLVSHGARILDLACGPGIYVEALARLGFRCHGIDFAPASIAHARAIAAGSECTFELADVRDADFGDGWDLVMMIFGQINVFERTVARDILSRALAALAPGGVLVVELEREWSTKANGEAPPSWQAIRAGLFSDRPHLLLEESAWDSEARTATTRWFVVDARTHEVTRHAMSTCAYAEGELEEMLSDIGFERIETGSSLATDARLATPEMFLITAHAPTDRT